MRESRTHRSTRRELETGHGLGTAAPAKKCVDSAGPTRPLRQLSTLPGGAGRGNGPVERRNRAPTRPNEWLARQNGYGRSGLPARRQLLSLDRRLANGATADGQPPALANCLIFTTCMMTRALHRLRADGVQIDPDAVAALEPARPGRTSAASASTPSTSARVPPPPTTSFPSSTQPISR